LQQCRFDSPQAIKGSSILQKQFKDSIPLLNQSKTYLFEIIYPENKIIVDYGNQESLTLLAVIDTETGNEEELTNYLHLGFPMVTKYKVDTIENLKKQNTKNKEGFVLKFKRGLRLKLKFEHYTRSHAIFSNISNITIWEMLFNKTPFADILENAPDELYNWIYETKNRFERKFKKIEESALQKISQIKNLEENYNKKEIAKLISTLEYPKLLFSILNEKDHEKIIWEMIKPKNKLYYRLNKQNLIK
jgi:RNA ligase